MRINEEREREKSEAAAVPSLVFWITVHALLHEASKPPIYGGSREQSVRGMFIFRHDSVPSQRLQLPLASTVQKALRNQNSMVG